MGVPPLVCQAWELTTPFGAGQSSDSVQSLTRGLARAILSNRTGCGCGDFQRRGLVRFETLSRSIRNLLSKHYALVVNDPRHVCRFLQWKVARLARRAVR
jgi:hypothetical protein